MSMTWRNPVALAGGLALGTPVLAMADPTIGGADSYTSQSTDGAIALLQVSTDETQTAYYHDSNDDLNTQRFEDDETLLASVERTGVVNNVTVAVIAVLIAAAALLEAFFVRSNKGEK